MKPVISTIDKKFMIFNPNLVGILGVRFEVGWGVKLSPV